MKIAMLIPQLALGGAEVDMRGMAIELQKGGHNVQVYCLNPGGPLRAGFNVPISYVPEVISPEFDLVIVMGPDAFENILRQFPNKILNYVCNITSGYYSPIIRDEYRFDGIIVDSQNTEDHVKAINPNAITMNHWYFMSPPSILHAEPNYSRWGVTEDMNIVGTLCAHRLVKKIPRLMDAFKKADIPNSIFLIAGSGPETEKWKAYGQETLGDKCRFVGVVEPSDLGQFYNCCSVFLNQYVDFAGGRCLTANEACGAGCYLITNEHGGAKENILWNNGVVIMDDVFDTECPNKLREFFRYSTHYRLSHKESARAQYTIRHSNQNEITEWVKRYGR